METIEPPSPLTITLSLTTFLPNRLNFNAQTLTYTTHPNPHKQQQSTTKPTSTHTPQLIMSDSDQQLGAKPIHSAYYHGRTTTKGEEAERYKPQLLDPSTPVEIAEDTPMSPSKWNKAQTFESCEFSQRQINRVMEQEFVGFEFPHKIVDVGTLTIVGMTAVTGFASRTFTRGKMMLNFELTITFTLAQNDELLDGATMTFSEVDFTCVDDFDIKYKGVTGPIGKALRGAEKQLRQKFQNFVSGMLAIPNEDPDY